jgi:hypothetical protein
LPQPVPSMASTLPRTNCRAQIRTDGVLRGLNPGRGFHAPEGIAPRITVAGERLGLLSLGRAMTVLVAAWDRSGGPTQPKQDGGLLKPPAGGRIEGGLSEERQGGQSAEQEVVGNPLPRAVHRQAIQGVEDPQVEREGHQFVERPAEFIVVAIRGGSPRRKRSRTAS